MSPLSQLSPRQIFQGNPDTAWEYDLHQSDKFRFIDKSEYDDFFALLKNAEQTDSYLTSPFYYLITGRKGLWVYQQQDCFIPFCWHPNVPGQILAFPFHSKITPAILREFLSLIPEPPAGIRLARFNKNNFIHSSQFQMQMAMNAIQIVTVNELVMDWKFPVTILSTEKVASLSGHSFKIIRNHVRNAEKRGIKATYIESAHKPLLKKFIVAWGEKNLPNEMSRQEYIGFYDYLIDLHYSHPQHLHGLIYTVEDKVMAFNIWDISNSILLTANRYANLCDHSFRGLAEYTTFYLSKLLASQQIKYLNLGGSETLGLYKFKEKFIPAHCINTHSAEIIFDNLEEKLYTTSVRQKIPA